MICVKLSIDSSISLVYSSDSATSYSSIVAHESLEPITKSQLKDIKN